MALAGFSVSRHVPTLEGAPGGSQDGSGRVAEPPIPHNPNRGATGAGRERLPFGDPWPQARTSIAEQLCSEYTSLSAT